MILITTLIRCYVVNKILMQLVKVLVNCQTLLVTTEYWLQLNFATSVGAVMTTHDFYSLYRWVAFWGMVKVIHVGHWDHAYRATKLCYSPTPIPATVKMRKLSRVLKLKAKSHVDDMTDLTTPQ